MSSKHVELRKPSELASSPFASSYKMITGTRALQLDEKGTAQDLARHPIFIDGVAGFSKDESVRAKAEREKEKSHDDTAIDIRAKNEQALLQLSNDEEVQRLLLGSINQEALLTTADGPITALLLHYGYTPIFERQIHLQKGENGEVHCKIVTTITKLQNNKTGALIDRVEDGQEKPLLEATASFTLTPGANLQPGERIKNYQIAMDIHHPGIQACFTAAQNELPQNRKYIESFRDSVASQYINAARIYQESDEATLLSLDLAQKLATEFEQFRQKEFNSIDEVMTAADKIRMQIYNEHKTRLQESTGATPKNPSLATDTFSVMLRETYQTVDKDYNATKKAYQETMQAKIDINSINPQEQANQYRDNCVAQLTQAAEGFIQNKETKTLSTFKTRGPLPALRQALGNTEITDEKKRLAGELIQELNALKQKNHHYPGNVLNDLHSIIMKYHKLNLYAEFEQIRGKEKVLSSNKNKEFLDALGGLEYGKFPQNNEFAKMLNKMLSDAARMHQETQQVQPVSVQLPPPSLAQI